MIRAPGRVSRSIAADAVARALRSRPRAPTVRSSSSWPGQRPGWAAAASIAMLASAGIAMAAAVQACDPVALLTAGTRHAAPTRIAAQPSQLQARRANLRCSSSRAAPSPASARAGYAVGSVIQCSGRSPSIGAAMRSTAARPAATTASASAVPARWWRRRIARAPTPVVASSMSATCPNAPRRSHTTAANTAPAMTSSRAPTPSRRVWALGAPRDAIPGEAGSSGCPAVVAAATRGGFQIA